MKHVEPRWSFKEICLALMLNALAVTCFGSNADACPADCDVACQSLGAKTSTSCTTTADGMVSCSCDNGQTAQVPAGSGTGRTQHNKPLNPSAHRPR